MADLFDLALGNDTDERFSRWLAQNPGVFETFCRIALQYKRRTGKARWSADACLHQLRWEYEVVQRKDGEFKCNNNFSSRLARKAMTEVPELQDFFELRVLNHER